MTWFATRNFPESLTWGILISALAAVALAVPVRRSTCGQWAFWFGVVQTIAWVFFWLLFSLVTPLPGAISENLFFGPVIEQTIALGNTSNSFYSINRGGFVPGPKDFTPLPEPDDTSDNAMLITQKLSKWATDNDVDFLVRRNHGALLLSLANMLTFQGNAADFEKRSADDLLHDPTFQELANKQLRASFASSLTGMNGGKKTLAFQTRYERTGLVQVIGVRSDPPSVTIRYKLVLGVATNAAAAGKITEN